MRGADPAVVRDALSTADPLPGTAGFAGELDGRLVRDVLGRQPIFFDTFSPDSDRPAWSYDPEDLIEPTLLPAGHTLRLDGDDSETDTVGDAPLDRTESVWTLPDRDPGEYDESVARVEAAVLESVREVDAERLAVAFSGGIDSALVASGVPDAPCYVVGFPGCHDIAAAEAAADAMGRELRVVELTHEALERAVPEVVHATGRRNPMDVNIVLPLYLLAEAVAADGYDRLAVGQGADELFGGYAKVAEAADDPRVEAETVRGATHEMIGTLAEQLPRDVLALRHAGVEPVAPLLHDRVVDAALDLPGEALVSDGTRKVALRAAGEGVVPESVAGADKKAVQYGSYVSRELDRLARQAGFKRRMENHVGQYIESLL
ncbi:asparagine synthase C-terminal domain-containing protein [Salinirubrum litoreum]|uniref:Asparagine synthase C-terminal domain-containing protein n=1 Tax=Salinirubrum litoreum TaxID=1126234 RepID=A0ABD5R9Q8_9EURY|nr:asparagine synthase-related protein [Salinirubrum litoreum]